MEKKQSDLCLEILRRFHNAGILNNFILIGSWCIYFYNAVALRFLSFLSANTIKVKVEDFYVTLPHPANFALHKSIIFQRRLKEEKAVKDRNTAIEILKALINKGESAVIKQVFNSIPQKWQNRVIKGLNESQDKDILIILQNLNFLPKK